MKKATTVLLFILSFTYPFASQGQVSITPDNTRVQKQLPMTEAQKKTTQEVITGIKDKLNDLEQSADQIKKKSEEENRDQTPEFRRILEKFNVNRKKLKRKINAYEHTTFENSKHFELEITQMIKNLELELQRLENEVYQQKQPVIKQSEAH